MSADRKAPWGLARGRHEMRVVPPGVAPLVREIILQWDDGIMRTPIQLTCSPSWSLTGVPVPVGCDRQFSPTAIPIGGHDFDHDDHDHAHNHDSNQCLGGCGCCTPDLPFVSVRCMAPGKLLPGTHAE
eukprot:COSAG01_NODE_1768_length_9274_cov_3.118583_6_plen_128_part_00